MPFVEALRQFQFRVGRDSMCVVHVSLVPVLCMTLLATLPTHISFLVVMYRFIFAPLSSFFTQSGSVGEQKTKPTQHSVRDLRSNGLGPRYVLRFQFAFRLPSVALSAAVPPILSRLPLEKSSRSRSAERRVGKECVSTCRYWWSPSD